MNQKNHPFYIGFVSFCLLLQLTACEATANPSSMTAGIVPDSIVSSHAAIHNAIEIGDISGGSDTNQSWHRYVSVDSFRQALEQSLQLNVLLASDGGRYKLDVKFQSLDTPSFGMDMTDTASIEYTLTKIATGKVVFDETITSSHTTDFSEAYVGFIRARITIEATIHDSIQAFITKVIATPALK